MIEAMENNLLAYKSVFVDISSTFSKYLDYPHPNYSYPLDFVKDVQKYGSFTYEDISVCLCMALAITLVRLALTAYILAPWAQWLQLSKINEEKLPESAWKTLHHTFTWIYSAYLLLLPHKYDFFFNARYMWADWEAKQTVPIDIYVLYMIEIGVYIHSLYGTLYLDHWRKDSSVMLFHHVVSILLLVFSYAIRYYKVGILVMFLHDIADVILEFSKCNVYVKNRGGKSHALNNHMATAGFLTFTAIWFVGRLYWFPFKVLHPAGHYAMYNGTLKFEMPFYIFFNGLLWMILSLNVYWFWLILKVLYRVATGQMKEVEDVRENDVIERMNKAKHVANGKNHTNGTNGTIKKPLRVLKKD